MTYRVLADVVLVVHLAFVVFVALGALLTLVWRWAPLAHLPALGWGVYIEIAGTVCPLTPLENSLRRAAGEAGYAGGFIEHYLVPIVYPGGLTPSTQLGLGIGLAAFNAVAYAWLLVRRRARAAPPVPQS